MTRPTIRPIAATLAALIVVASGSDDADDATDATTDVTTEEAPSGVDTAVEDATLDSAVTPGLDPAAFFDGALVGDVSSTECTLSDGELSDCYELTIAGFPANRDSIGPWCPATTSDGAAGIWFDGQAVYDIDGEFILDLAEIYDDDTWKLYDDEGNVLSTDTSEEFNDLVTGGVREDADAGPVNLCVYGEIEWTQDGGSVPITVEIPATPTMADAPTGVSDVVGVTLDGVRIEGSAPIDLILGNYTIGAFDPCGGHVNPQEGYHMHATTGCSDSAADVPDGETALFGYALDGFAIHAPYEAGSDAEAELDECNGHETDELGYHYHANQVEENAVLTCFNGATAGGAGGNGGGPPTGAGPPPGGDRPPADG